MPRDSKSKKRTRDRRRGDSRSRSRSESRTRSRSRSRSRSYDRRRSRSPNNRRDKHRSRDDEQPKKRKSRFDKPSEPEVSSVPIVENNPTAVALAAAAAKAAEIAKELQLKKSLETPVAAIPPMAMVLPTLTTGGIDDAAAKAARAREIQNQIAAQLASVTSLLQNSSSTSLSSSSLLLLGQNKTAVTMTDRKAAYRPLLLDSEGREIDERGQLVKLGDQIKTLAANVAVGQARRKVDNPYLAHRLPPPVAVGTVTGTESVLVPAVEPLVPVVDDRLKTVKKVNRAKRAFNFVEEGSFADKERLKEERKIIAGYTSGRRAPQVADDKDREGDGEGVGDVEGGGTDTTTTPSTATATAVVHVPPPCDEGIIPVMEWWDEALLPKGVREERKRSRAAQDKEDDCALRALQHTKTYKYIQHPLPVKPLGGEKGDEPMPIFLTKKERKWIRRTARESREREKRDKMMMGLIPVLGEQAVSDPSKVEQRVMRQMQQRVMNHEMRNQARKLTPAERKEKKRKKLHEDTSRQVVVAVFRVKDFSNLKHRFKVDVNAQQYNLSGIVLLCSGSTTNLIVVEGGPRGIRRFIKLMLNRIHWDTMETVTGAGAGTGGFNEDDEGDDDRGEDGSDNEEEKDNNNIQGMALGMDNSDNNHNMTGSGSGTSAMQSSCSDNRCDLLWQGIVAKRTFHAFRFQECRTAAAARKVLEAKGTAHYWDTAMRADTLLTDN
eukprot:gene5310-10621_t